MSTPLALLADPDTDARLIYRTALERAAWRVEEASDGRSALAYAITNRPDVIVTLDEFLANPAGREDTERALDRTLRWARRCRAAQARRGPTRRMRPRSPGAQTTVSSITSRRLDRTSDSIR